jgi:hypothetical protein
MDFMKGEILGRFGWIHRQDAKFAKKSYSSTTWRPWGLFSNSKVDGFAGAEAFIRGLDDTH